MITNVLRKALGIGQVGQGFGRSSFTAWVWIGMVMMNMIRSTSMTSINGVVFISIIGEPSSLPPDIAMVGYSWILVCLEPAGDQPFGSTGFEMKPTVGYPAACTL